MITSASNPKLRLVHRLLESRRQREKEGLFVAEGEDLVQAADDAGIEPVELLRAGEDVEADLLAKVSTMAHPPRVLGIYRREALPRGVEPLSLSLWHVADPGNLGTILRSADAFGASVALSPGCADPTGPKALRASAGAVFRVPIARFRRAGGEADRARLGRWAAAGGARARGAGHLRARRGAGGPAGRGRRGLRRVGDDSARARLGVAERRDRGRNRALRAPARPGRVAAWRRSLESGRHRRARAGAWTVTSAAGRLPGKGLEGCAHANPPKREVLFVSKEHLDAVGVEPGAIRENLTVEGDDVERWPIGQRVRAGGAVFEITMVCDPCHRMDELRQGLRAELEGRRGMLARIVESGEVAVGDEIELL